MQLQRTGRLHEGDPARSVLSCTRNVLSCRRSPDVVPTHAPPRPLRVRLDPHAGGARGSIRLARLQPRTGFLGDLDSRAVFSRRLHKSDCVLWWSPSARPDLGGREADANASQLGDELNNPELDRPGCYSNACLEIELRNLAVDAVLQSALVYELEGGEGAGVEEGAHNLDDYAKGAAGASHVLGDAILPTSTFNMVRSMVKAWSVEASKGDGALWRLMLEHFWRWISSPASNLYDPALYRFVHGLMRKTFSQLLAEFRRLGSDIVHADFGRIFLVTNKPSSSTAFAYANYVVSSVTTRELFRYLQLDLVRFWDQLVWMDAANSAGIICERPDLDEAPIGIKTIIELQFNIATYLPPAVQGSFARIVALFVRDMLLAKRAQVADLRTPLRILQNGLETAGRNGSKAGEKEGEDGPVDAAKALVSGKLTRELLKATSELKEKYDNRADLESFQFPVLPGSHLRLKNPVLEFVKTTCAVLSLARDCGEEVIVLKRNLLDFIGVREFAKEAMFVNPCLPFKVPMVVCRACNSIRGEFVLLRLGEKMRLTRVFLFFRPRPVSERDAARQRTALDLRTLLDRVRPRVDRGAHHRRTPAPHGLLPAPGPPLRQMPHDEVREPSLSLPVRRRVPHARDAARVGAANPGHVERCRVPRP